MHAPFFCIPATPGWAVTDDAQWLEQYLPMQPLLAGPSTDPLLGMPATLARRPVLAHRVQALLALHSSCTLHATCRIAWKDVLCSHLACRHCVEYHGFAPDLCGVSWVVHCSRDESTAFFFYAHLAHRLLAHSTHSPSPREGRASSPRLQQQVAHSVCLPHRHSLTVTHCHRSPPGMKALSLLLLKLAAHARRCPMGFASPGAGEPCLRCLRVILNPRKSFRTKTCCPGGTICIPENFV